MSPREQLTYREIKVTTLVWQGRTNPEIALNLGTSEQGLDVPLENLPVLRGDIHETYANAKAGGCASHRTLQAQLGNAQPQHDFELAFHLQRDVHLDETTALAQVRSPAPDDLSGRMQLHRDRTL